MSAIDVLARALHETTHGSKTTWENLTPSTQESWIRQAEVVAARMLEAEPAGAVVPTIIPLPADGEPLTLTGSITTLLGSADYLNDVARTIPAHTPADLIQCLSRLRETIRVLQTVDAAIVREVYIRCEHSEQEIEGVGRVKIMRGRERRSWDGRGVVRAVIDAQMEKRGYEVPDDPWDVAEWLLEVFPTDRPRVTPLRALGIEPREFCEDSPGKPTVQLPPT